MIMMKVIFFLIIGLSSFNKTPAITKEFVEKLKKLATWEVEEYENNIFKGWSDSEIRSILNFYLPISVSNYTKSLSFSNKLPDNFDPRDKFGYCIHSIRDQGNCGSNWAFALTEILSDRFCIKGKNVVLSPQDLVSCDRTDYGCNGGFFENALNYSIQTGIVLDTCFPYVSSNGIVPPCPFKCTGIGDWIKYKCTPGSIFNAADNNEKMNQLYNNGPIENAFSVYTDFFNYKSGVYYHVSGALVGVHISKTLGWGIDPPTGLHYWLLANSWGSNWGMNGFFKFKMGDCQIDEYGWGCNPLI